MGERYNWHLCDRTEIYRLLLYLVAGRLLLAVEDDEACRATLLRGRDELPAALEDYAARYRSRRRRRVVEVLWDLYGSAGELEMMGRHTFTPGGAPE